MKVDVYKHEKRYKSWKAHVLNEGVNGLSKANSAIVIEYVSDMEVGRNVARGTKKGGRSYAQLTNLHHRMRKMLVLLQKRGVHDVRDVDEPTVSQLFSDFERGRILTMAGTPYQSVGDYVRVFKSFWHWWMKVNRKQGKMLQDITEDLSARGNPPKFVYLKKEDVDALLPYFDRDEQVVLLFLFDSLIRSPTELLSLRRHDVYEVDGETWVSIPDDASKTFGRSFNLLYSGPALQEYIRRKGLKPEDPLFEFSYVCFNRQLKRVTYQIFGDRLSHPQCDYYKNISMYDFRHSGAIHLRVLAKNNPGAVSLDAIRHRAGWTNFDMLNYYTRFIGMDGRIEKRGILIPREQQELEIEIGRLRAQLAEALGSARPAPTALPESVASRDIETPTASRRQSTPRMLDPQHVRAASA